ncbi:hypothetical protein Ahp2_78 [Aeromonas phage Ahp2]|nr:hypothetical protein Ahp2_78 [Aeromonas phage Ahp2]
MTTKIKWAGGLALFTFWHIVYVQQGAGDPGNAIGTALGFWASFAIWWKLITLNQKGGPRA